MNEKSTTNIVAYRMIHRLVRTLRVRYFKYNDFIIGLIALSAGEKLLRNYYRKHKNNAELLKWRGFIFENIAEFQEDLKKYEIIEKKRSK